MSECEKSHDEGCKRKTFAVVWVKWWGRDNERTFMQSALARLREAIMMHEGPLHVYDMIVSDLLAPHGN